MLEFPRQKLCELINEHGTIVGEDAERCEFFLRNACGGDYKREVFVLVNAIKEDVPKELLNPPQGLPLDVVFNLLAQRLYENLWLDQTAAHWAVESWAIALGVQKISTLAIDFEEDYPPNWQVQSITLTQSPSEVVIEQTPPPKRLSPLNPFDLMRLLWWVLVMPQHLQAYRQAFEDDEMRTGNWLVSTLTWWPLLIPTLALGLERWPTSNQIWLPEGYLLMSALLALCWFLTGMLSIKRGITVILIVFISGISAGIAAGTVTVGMESLASIEIALGTAIGIALIIAGIVAVVVAGDVATVVAGVVAVGVAVGIAVGVTIDMKDIMTGFIAGGVAGFIVGFVVDFIGDLAGNLIGSHLKTKSSSFVIRFAFFLLILAHLFLMGLFFFGWHHLGII
jgi:hypothetical protein